LIPTQCTPLPLRAGYESKAYEISGISQPPEFYISKQGLAADIIAAAEILFEEEFSAGLEKRLIGHSRSYFLRDDLSGPMALGQLSALGIGHKSYQLAFTKNLVTKHYGSKVSEAMLADALYEHSEGDEHWWTHSGTAIYPADPKASFYNPIGVRDVFGNASYIEYDNYTLLVEKTTDAIGNTVSSINDYRTLSPVQITDPNLNRAAVETDELGLVIKSAVMGKEGAGEGDTLADPTARMEYDLFNWQNNRKPNVVHTFAREQHGAANPRWQESYVYSDGGGNVIMSKAQAEPGKAKKWNAVTKEVEEVAADPRWVGNGRTIINNKGNPVKQYEPYFSDTHEYESEDALVETGVTPILFYDPLGRVIATLHPNHTYEKVVFDPWQQTTYDVNDTVTFDPEKDADIGGFLSRLPDDYYLPTWHQLRTDLAHAAEFTKQYPDAGVRTNETKAADKAADHADTPTTAHLDSLGRPFLTFADNGLDPSQPNQHLLFATRVELDIEGNQRSVEDAKGRVVMRYEYDMLGSRIHQASMEAGERWTLNDAAGKPLRTWDSRGFSHRMEYDALRRPIAHYVSDNGQPERQIEKTIYGDTPGALANPEQNNHRGKPYQVFDSAGVVVSEEFDFKGNLLRSSRQLPQDYKGVSDWSAQPALEEEIFSSSTRYDALNRPIQLTAPRSNRAGSTANVIQPAYNEAKLLERVHVWLGKAEEPAALLDPATASFQPVTNIDYDAKGQRSRIAYGNGTTSDYAYDEKTFRLTQLKTTRAADGAGLQDLRYAYDPAGNITRIRDEAQQTVFFRNQAVEPHCDYTYDALYRLIAAEGREHIGQTAQPESSWSDEFRIHQPHPHDGQALRRYLERYLYDAVGNFAQLEHQADNGNWTRSYAYEEASLLEPGKVSNRLSRTVLRPNSSNPVVEPYSYDAHGNMTQMPHLPLMAWDFRDQLCASSRQAVSNGNTPEITYYVYDSSGQRVRKVTEGQAAAGGAPAKRNERIYLGGFEVYREYKGGSCALERESLHLMDDKQRIALVETKTFDADSREDVGVPLLRYQLGNHLGSASLELDKDGAVISYEEYHPYGSTAFQAGRSKAEVSLKRYRYTGMERDEETGLNYHGARYYAGWLGRWVSCDPTGLVDGNNLYKYSKGNPITFVDPSGYESIEEVAQRELGIQPQKNSDVHWMKSADERLLGLPAGATAPKVDGIIWARSADERLLGLPAGATAPVSNNTSDVASSDTNRKNPIVPSFPRPSPSESGIEAGMGTVSLGANIAGVSSFLSFAHGVCSPSGKIVENGAELLYVYDMQRSISAANSELRALYRLHPQFFRQGVESMVGLRLRTDLGFGTSMFQNLTEVMPKTAKVSTWATHFGVAISGIQTVRHSANENYLEASVSLLDTAFSAAGYSKNPYLWSLSVGYSAGQLLDGAVGVATGEKISDRLGNAGITVSKNVAALTGNKKLGERAGLVTAGSPLLLAGPIGWTISAGILLSAAF
jgi:RHS repeat-associated protein